MSIFEYIMVLTSIIIGLGITELLTGLVRILRSTHKEGFFFPQAMWGLFIFLHLLIIWWTRWDLRHSIDWTFVQLLLSLTAPTLLFILAGLVFPHNRSSVDHYHRHRVSFFTIFSVVIFVDLIHEIFIEGSSLISPVSFIVAVALTSTLLCRFTTDNRIHGAAATITVATWTGYVLFVESLLK